MSKSRLKWSILLGEQRYEFTFAPASSLSWQPNHSRLIVSGFMADVENSPVPSHPGPTLWLVDKDGNHEDVREVLGCSKVAWSNDGKIFASSEPLAVHVGVDADGGECGTGGESGAGGECGTGGECSAGGESGIKTDADGERRGASCPADPAAFVPTAFPEGDGCGTHFICWSPDDKLLAANKGLDVCFFDVKTKKLVATFESPKNYNKMSGTWSAKSGTEGTTLLYVAFPGGPIIGLNGKGEEKVRVDCDDCSGLVVCSPNGELLAELYDGKRAIRVRKVAGLEEGGTTTLRGHCVTLRGHSEIITDCCWSPCSKFCATASFDKTVRIWRVSDGAEVFKTSPDGCRLTEKIAWSSGGRWIAVICRIYGKFSYCLKVIDIGDYPSMKKRQVKRARNVFWKPVDQEVRALALAPKGKTIYMGGLPGEVNAYSVDSWKKKWSVHFSKDLSVINLELSSDGRLLAAAADEGPLRLLDSRKGSIKWELNEFALDEKHRHFYIASLHFAGGGKLLGVHSCTVDNSAFQLFDWQSGEELWREKTNQSFKVAVSPSGSYIAISRYSKLALHQAVNGKKRWTVGVDFPDELLWLSDMSALAIAESGNVKVVTRNEGKTLWSAQHPFADSPCLAYTPEKAILALAADWSKNVYLRDGKSGKLLKSIEGVHENKVTALGFARGGKYLVSASVDQFIRIFSVPTGKLVAKTQYASGHPFALSLCAAGKMLVANDCGKEVPIWDLSALN